MWIRMHGTRDSTVEIRPPNDQSNVVLYTVFQIGSGRDCIIHTNYPYTCNIRTGEGQTRYEYQSYVLLHSGNDITSVRRVAWTPPNRKHYVICSIFKGRGCDSNISHNKSSGVCVQSNLF